MKLVQVLPLMSLTLSASLGIVPALARPHLQVYGLCQYLTGPLKTISPTLGCPPGTVFVSQTNEAADFPTINEALDSLPEDLSPRWILVDAGEYKETLNISRKGPITLLGATSSVQPKDYINNLATIFDTRFMNTSDPNKLADNSETSVLNLAPNKYAAWTGAGFFGAPGGSDEFGTDNFKAYNLNFENRAANKSQGPALALNLGYVKASFYGCTFKSWQDTIFVGKNASAFFTQSQILGQTDFIYGFGTAWFSNSTLGMRGSGGYVTAWKGVPDDPTLPSGYTNDDNLFGAYIWNSSIIKSPDSDPALDITGKFALGRPWNNISRTVIQHTYLDDSIKNEGFNTWSANTYDFVKYAEYKNYGPGWTPEERIYFDHILTDDEAKNFTLGRVFGGDLSWIDFLY